MQLFGVCLHLLDPALLLSLLPFYDLDEFCGASSLRLKYPLTLVSSYRLYPSDPDLNFLVLEGPFVLCFILLICGVVWLALRPCVQPRARFGAFLIASFFFQDYLM